MAFNSAARLLAPISSNSSACILDSKPKFLAASKMTRDSSTEKAPFSQKTSQNSAKS